MVRSVMCFLVVVFLLCLGGPAAADNNRVGSADVKEDYIILSGTSCDDSTVTTDTDPRRSDAGAADVNSNPVAVYNTHKHSISYEYVAANAGSSFVLTLQHRTKWGDWKGFSPAVTVTLAGASGGATAALNLPACAEIRVVRSSDATYATTLTACTINRY